MLKRKILMVIAPNNFRDEELFEPKKRFEEEDFDVVVASEKLMAANGMLGGSVTVQKKVTDVSPEGFDAVVFVGGSGVAEYRLADNVHYTELAKKFYAAGKLVCAICLAPTILASAGLLTGKKATVYKNASGEIEKCGAEYTGDDVTIDGRIITACGPETAKKFAVAILRGLEEGRLED